MTWSMMMIPLLLLLANRPSVQSGPQPDDPSSPAHAPRLSAEDKAILSDVVRLQTDLGEDLWPGYGRASIPIILYNERYEFLIGETTPPPPWVVVESDSFGGNPYYRRDSSNPQAFAVPVGTGWAGSLTSFEAINRGGPMKMMKITREYYVSLVHHEMFHAFQASRGEDHFRQAGRAYSAEARYPGKDKGFMSAWDKEGAVLAVALNANDDATRRRAVREFLQVRDARRAQAALSPDLLAFERELEWLEGLAKYVEFRLHDLVRARRVELADPTPPPASPYWHQADMFRLAKRLGQQNGDLRFYLSGMAQARVLDRLSPGWKEKAMEAGVYLEDLLRATLESE